MFLVLPVHADENDDHVGMAAFYAGTYVLVGKQLDSDDTFVGTIVLEQAGDRLEGYRLVSGVRTKVSATIEHPLCCESAHLLRIKFKDGDRELEGSYLLDSDLDNYGRLSGFVFDPNQRSDWPGMEVLFFDKRSIRDGDN